MDRNIRSVSLEILREGPPHNQLLSPLTRYLGRCGDAAAEVISVPYEHRIFMRRLSQLRYRSGVGEDERYRYEILEQTGREIAAMLGKVPGFVATLNHLRSATDPLVHFQLELSPSELALLPFELSTVPATAPGSPADWLSLQTLVPVTMTRRVHGVSAELVTWPRHPRVLFAWSDAEGKVDHEEHERALQQSLDPWKHPADGFDDLLRVLPHASLSAIQTELERRPYGYVHLLAHGVESDEMEGRGYGLGLYNAAGTRSEFVSGSRLASVLCPVTRPRSEWPAVVSVASCDSGNVGSVHDRTGASLAHNLHQAGICMVVASQFPLSQSGATLVTGELYRGLVSGEDPRILLHRLRIKLYSHNERYHDWASLVVYAAFPPDLEQQLAAVRYWQARRADDRAFDFVNHTLDEALDDAQAWEDVTRRVEAAIARYPRSGEFRAESEGMRGSGFKRMAQARFQLARVGKEHERRLDECLHDLDAASRHYWHAVEIFLAPGAERVQRLASLHWVLTQWLSIEAVLGRPIKRGLWMTAKVSAEMDLKRYGGANRVWPLGSLAELYLLQLTLSEDGRESGDDWCEEALRCIEELVDVDREPDSVGVCSTRRGFDRYLNWWGTDDFVGALDRRSITRPVDWSQPGGVVETAGKIVAALR